jgi:hypothetical protein
MATIFQQIFRNSQSLVLHVAVKHLKLIMLFQELELKQKITLKSICNLRYTIV